jgi:hypothetical protein
MTQLTVPSSQENTSKLCPAPIYNLGGLSPILTKRRVDDIFPISSLFGFENDVTFVVPFVMLQKMKKS